MEDSTAPLSARSNGSPAVKTRAKSNWQRASFSASRSRTSSSSSSKGASMRRVSTPITVSKSHDSVTDKSNEKAVDKEPKVTKNQLEVDLESYRANYDEAKRRIQELESKCNDLSRKHRTSSAELELNKERLYDVENENKRLHRKLSAVNSNLDTTKSRLTNMEWKAMEYEKLSILNDNLKNKNENLRQDNRDLERRLQSTDTLVEDLKKKLEEKQREVDTVDERMKDLRLQVREENIKNIRLDKEVEDLQGVRESCADKENLVSQLQKKLTETEYLLEHARRSWRTERDKLLAYENEDKRQDDMKSEVHMVRAENMTLKGMLVAKDKLLIEKTRLVANIKGRVSKCDVHYIEADVIRAILESKPEVKVSFPSGNKIKEQISSSSENFAVNGWVSESTRTESHPSGRSFIDTLLHNDDAHNNNTSPSPQAKRPKTAIVRPNNYKSQSFVNFRSESEDLLTHETTQSCADIKYKDNKTQRSNVPATQKLKRGQSVRDKRQLHKHTNGTENQQSRIRRTKSLENKIPLEPTPDMLRSSSPAGWSSTRASSVSISTVGSCGSACVPAIMFRHAPSRDRAISKIARIGDRVCVDMARSKEKRKQNFQQGVIKFIGNLDKEYDCYKIYIGIKLDEPDGDTDGLYKNKRYFKVPQNHGKFVHITRIKSIQNRQSLRFRDIEDLLQKNKVETGGASDRGPEASHESFELNL